MSGIQGFHVSLFPWLFVVFENQNSIDSSNNFKQRLCSAGHNMIFINVISFIHNSKYRKEPTVTAITISFITGIVNILKNHLSFIKCFSLGTILLPTGLVHLCPINEGKCNNIRYYKVFLALS